MDTKIAAVLSLALVACDADLETACVGGDCAPYEPTIPSPSECYESCDVTQPSFAEGEIPCAVDPILDNCRRCHTPGGEGPFSLETYADVQADYFGKPVWARLDGVVRGDIMPAAEPKLTDGEKATLLDGWACQCAPPRAPGETCD